MWLGRSGGANAKRSIKECDLMPVVVFASTAHTAHAGVEDRQRKSAARSSQMFDITAKPKNKMEMREI